MSANRQVRPPIRAAQVCARKWGRDYTRYANFSHPHCFSFFLCACPALTREESSFRPKALNPQPFPAPLGKTQLPALIHLLSPDKEAASSGADPSAGASVNGANPTRQKELRETRRQEDRLGSRANSRALEKKRQGAGCHAALLLLPEAPGPRQTAELRMACPQLPLKASSCARLLKGQNIAHRPWGAAHLSKTCCLAANLSPLHFTSH